MEVIVQNKEDAKQAERLGADRLEFVSAISEGGLTPSYGMMKQVFESVSLPIYTMIRPHSHHFVFDYQDFEVMKEDIQQVLSLGRKRIVFGAIHEDGTINEEMLKRIIDLSPELEITFHRAFDETIDQIEAYRTLAKYDQVKWILTSGGADTCLAGQETLQELVQLSKQMNGPEILPGSGLNIENIADIHQTVQANQYHFGSAVRKHGSFAHGFDEDVFQTIVQTIT